METGRVGVPRVYPIGELDGFYVDETSDRCIHVTFDEEDVIVVDLFDTARAAHAPVGDVLSTVELNLTTGEARLCHDGR